MAEDGLHLMLSSALAGGAIAVRGSTMWISSSTKDVSSRTFVEVSFAQKTLTTMPTFREQELLVLGSDSVDWCEKALYMCG